MERGAFRPGETPWRMGLPMVDCWHRPKKGAMAGRVVGPRDPLMFFYLGLRNGVLLTTTGMSLQVKVGKVAQTPIYFWGGVAG